MKKRYDAVKKAYPDKKIEKNLIEMESGSELERTAAVKALVIQAQTDEKWMDPII